MGQLWTWGLGHRSARDLSGVGEIGLRHGSTKWVNGLVRHSGLAKWVDDVELRVG